VWNGFRWLRMQKSCEPLWIRQWSFGGSTMCGEALYFSRFACIASCREYPNLHHESPSAWIMSVVLCHSQYSAVETWWHTVTHGRGKWRENWQMEWVASTIHTTSEHGVSSITTADAHSSPASSRLNWRPRRFKCTRPFCRKTKSGFVRVCHHISTGLYNNNRTTHVLSTR
jgi:hypothetical protein